MEYIKLINSFWETNRNTQFTMAETTLYFYLLNEANRIYWQMPIVCATAIICASTGMTKATLIRARNGLKKKGLIGFTEGVNILAPQPIISAHLKPMAKLLTVLLIKLMPKPLMQPLLKTTT